LPALNFAFPKPLRIRKAFHADAAFFLLFLQSSAKIQRTINPITNPVANTSGLQILRVGWLIVYICAKIASPDSYRGTDDVFM